MREFAIDTPLGRIAGLHAGTPGAPRVLALHGWLDNAASFLPLAPFLDGIELVAIDMPGHGRSAHLPAGADYSFAGALANLLDVADALGWDRFGLLGHSMGGAIASLLAAACPERVTRLLVARGLRAVDGGYTWSSDPRLTLPTLVRMTEAQVEALVAGISCPVRAIFADPAQPYLPDALRRSRTRLLPAGEIVVMPGGHHLHMQQPAEVAAAIGDFLRGG